MRPASYGVSKRQIWRSVHISQCGTPYNIRQGSVMQMLRKRVGIIAATAVVALSLAACNRGVSSTGGASGGKTPYIGIVSKGFSQTFWQAVKKGAETEAKKEGAKITFELSLIH